MATQIMLKTCGVPNVENICDKAINGEIAVQMIKDDYEKKKFCSYNLILMDQNMPVMDGSSASRSIREFLCQMDIEQPLICGVTGHIEQEYINRAIKNGMNYVYSKPLNLNIFKKLLKKMNYI